MSDEASLLDILTHGQRAIRAANERERFLNDDNAQSAVAYCISVMGEAVKRISPEFQQAHPEIPWSGHRAHARSTDSFLSPCKLEYRLGYGDELHPGHAGQN